ncbi:BON domain-containing protein [Shewanella sp. SM32]
MSGNVNSQAQKDQAERVTAATSGVHSVNNRLEVK